MVICQSWFNGLLYVCTPLQIISVGEKYSGRPWAWQIFLPAEIYVAQVKSFVSADLPSRSNEEKSHLVSKILNDTHHIKSQATYGLRLPKAVMLIVDVHLELSFGLIHKFIHTY